MKRLLILSAPLLLMAVPVFAQDAAPAAQTSANDLPVTSKPNKVCRKAAVTGQRIARTKCHTREEWAAIDEANREAAKNFTTSVGNNATRNPGGGGMGGVSAIPN